MYGGEGGWGMLGSDIGILSISFFSHPTPFLF